MLAWALTLAALLGSSSEHGTPEESTFVAAARPKRPTAGKRPERSPTAPAQSGEAPDASPRGATSETDGRETDADADVKAGPTDPGATGPVHTGVDRNDTPKSAGRRTVVMMPLSSLGSTEEAAQVVQRILVMEVQKILGGRLVPPDELYEHTGTSAGVALSDCDGVLECLIEVFGALGWGRLILANVAGLGDDRVINIKLIDLTNGQMMVRVSGRAVGDEGQLVRNMRKAAVQLLAPERYVGILQIEAAQPSVEVSVDGSILGKTPLPKNRVDVPVGRHSVEANGEGLVPFSTIVDVDYEEVKPVAILLPENTVFVGGEVPYYATWWTWAIAGAGVLATGIGGYFNYLHASDVDAINQRAIACREGGDCKLTAATNDLYKNADKNWTTALVFYGVGGALVGGAGVLLTIDLF